MFRIVVVPLLTVIVAGCAAPSKTPEMKMHIVGGFTEEGEIVTLYGKLFISAAEILDELREICSDAELNYCSGAWVESGGYLAIVHCSSGNREKLDGKYSPNSLEQAQGTAVAYVREVNCTP